MSCCNDDCDAAALGEDILTLLPDVSSPPPPVSPSRCGDDVLGCSCPCCCLGKRSAMMSAVARRAFEGSVASGCGSGGGCGWKSLSKSIIEVYHADVRDVVLSEVFLVLLRRDVQLFFSVVL